MINLVDDTLNSIICEQIAHELYNANLYLYMSAFLKNEGLDNIAKHFDTQHEEETSHAKELIKLLTDLSSPVVIPEIDEVNMPFESIISLATAYLDREILTTKSINEIKKLAISMNNPVIEERMRRMIEKQQHEYEEATTFLDKAMLCGNDWWKAMVWNDSLG